MGVDHAITPTADGIQLCIEVQPNAKGSRFPTGYNRWRGYIQARVKAPPKDGKANQELIQVVANVLGVPPSHVRVVTGQRDRRKQLRITSIDADTASRRIKERL